MTAIYGVLGNADIDASEDVAVIDTEERKSLFLSFTVSVTLTAFTVEFAVSHVSDYFTVASAAVDFTAPEGFVLAASGDLTGAAGGATVHWLKLDVSGMKRVRIKAASTNCVLVGHYTLGD